MAITQHNYESYFIDYHEGRLSEARIDELKAFLATHPELVQEFEDYDVMSLDPDLNITYINKSSIKRSEETGLLLEDEKAIAWMEGDADMGANEEILSGIFAKTILQADPSIVYPDPGSLKKRIILIPSYARYAAAAIILLLISLGIWQVSAPGFTTERIHYELASLESRTTEFGNHPRQEMHLDYRPVLEMQMRSENRETLQLSRLAVRHPDKIITPTILATNQVIYPRQIHEPPATGSYQDLAISEAPREKTLLGKIISGFFGKAKAPFEINNASPKEGSDNSFSIWALAEMGMKGVNALGDHEYTVVRDYNEKGNVKGLIVLEE
jgi:hypothetical protein